MSIMLKRPQSYRNAIHNSDRRNRDLGDVQLSTIFRLHRYPSNDPTRYSAPKHAFDLVSNTSEETALTRSSPRRHSNGPHANGEAISYTRGYVDDYVDMCDMEAEEGGSYPIRVTEYHHGVPFDKKNLCNIFDMLRPISITLTVFGCFSYRSLSKDVSASLTGTNPCVKLARRIFDNRLYTITYMSLIWFNSVRYMIACIFPNGIRPRGDVTVIVNTIWIFFCALTATTVLRNCMNSERLPSLLDQCHKAQAIMERVDYYDKAGLAEIRGYQKRVRVITFLYLTWSVGIILFNFMDFQGSSAYSNVLTIPFPNTHILVAISFLLFNMMCTAVQNLPLLLFVTFCMFVTQGFRLISKRIAYFAKQSLSSADMESIRHDHQLLTSIVRKGDSVFSSLLSITYISNLPLSCFSVYNITQANDVLGIISLLVWLIVGLLNVGFVSWYAGGVYEEAHAPLQHIYNIKVPEDASESFVLQVHLFLSKLDGSPIAFTLSNLASVTKSFAVTMAGLCITYTTIAIQMRPLFEQN